MVSLSLYQNTLLFRKVSSAKRQAPSFPRANLDRLHSIGRSFCLCEDLRLLPRPTSFGATVPFPSPASPSLRRRRQRWTVRQRTVSAHRRRLLLQDVATSGSPTSAATAPTPPSRLLSKLLLLSFLARQPNP